MEPNKEAPGGSNLFSPIEGATDSFGTKLDSIFEEVEKNLPSIDFDISDVSSDEEVAIFHRTIKTPTFDEDKDLDESLTSESWEELLRAADTSNMPTPNNDIMAHFHHAGTTSGSKGQLTSLAMDSDPQDLSERQSYSGLSLAHTEDSVSTLSLRSIREVDIEADIDTTPTESEQGTQPRKTHSMGTNTTGTSTDDIKINTWVGSESVTDSSDIGDGSQKQTDVPQSGRIGSDNRISDEKIAQPGKPSDLVSRYIPSRGPSLTFQDLDNIDLDAALSMHEGGRPVSLPLPRTTATTRAPTRPSPTPSTSTGRNTMQADDDENISLIEKLARLTVAQSGQRMQEYDPNTGAVAQPDSGGDFRQSSPPEQEARKVAEGPNKSMNTKAMKTAHNKNMEAQQKSGLPLGASGQDPSITFSESMMMQFGLGGPSKAPKKEQSRDTIYIDLRNFDVEKHQQQLSFEAVQRILRLGPQNQPEESSSDEEEVGPVGDLSLWHAQRRKMKEALREGKNIAHPENYNTEKPVEAAKLTKPEPPKKVAKSQREPSSPQKAAATTQKSTGTETKTADVGAQGDSQSKAETGKPPLSAAAQAEKERQKRIETAKKAREARAAEHQSRVRLGQRLEALRPTTTVSERHPAAEATPVVFDLEASYEPALENLPTDLVQEREVLLLTVHMACNGEIVLHRGSANRSVDTGHGLSASYTTLVTWILSLVPDDFSFLKSPPGSTTRPASSAPGVPFQVVALQQMVLDEQLALYIAVCPTDATSHNENTPKGKKAKKRDDFSSILSKFLSTNTLLSVCSWLEDLVSMEVTSPLSEDRKPFIYRPPLPNITNKPLSTFIQINSGMEAVRRVFSLPVGFFWHTVESDDTLADVGDLGIDKDVQNTMSLIYKKIYRDPRAMMGILNRLLQEGLDLSGLRLLYPTTALMSVAAGNLSAAQPQTGAKSNSPAESPSQLELLNKVGPIVALSIRGMLARTLWLDAVGPADPVLARRTDPNSLCALYGGNSRDECLLFCPRNPERISTELARWFGGRVPQNGVVNVGTAHRKRNNSGSKKSKGSKSHEAESDIPTNNPPAMLTATIRGHIVLVISPLLPTRFLGLVLATCQRRGYQLHGIRRQRLTAKRASSLGLAGVQVPAFTRGTCSPLQPDGVPYSDVMADPAAGDAPPTPCRPSTAIVLNKENATHSAASLIEAFMVQLCLMDLLGPIQSGITEPLTSALLFHTVPHSDSVMNVLGRDFSKVPEVDRVITPGYIAPKLHTNPEMEQIVTVTLTGHKNTKNFGILLGRLLGVVPLSRTSSGPPVSNSFELLGIKWLPTLSMQHAKELTPYEVGDPQWRASLTTLTSEPVVVVVLRGVDGFSRLANILLPSPGPQASHRIPKPSLECLVSRTPDATYRQMALFFSDRELFADPSVRKLLSFLPPLRPPLTERNHTQSEGADLCQEESLFETVLSGPQPIVTLLVAKPDVVRRNLGKLLKRLSHDGFALVGARLMVLSTEQADVVIPTEDKENEVLRDMHQSYLTSAPSMVLALQRENAIWRLQKILGPTDPAMARKSGQHFLRALFGSDAIANGLHASLSYSVAVEEVKKFFPEGLCCQPNLDLDEDGILCPAEDLTIDIRPTRTVTKGETTEQSQLPIATTKSSGTTPVNWSLPRSTLTETNCLLLMPSLLKQQGRGRRAPYVDIVDALCGNGFDVVGARLVWLTEEQAQHYLCLINAGSFQMVPLLRTGPVLVLALQRDNAVIAFDTLLGLYSKDSVYSKYSTQILRPKDNKQAKKHLAFFFDALSPVAELKISQGEEQPTTSQT